MPLSRAAESPYSLLSEETLSGYLHIVWRTKVGSPGIGDHGYMATRTQVWVSGASYDSSSKDWKRCPLKHLISRLRWQLVCSVDLIVHGAISLLLSPCTTLVCLHDGSSHSGKTAVFVAMNSTMCRDPQECDVGELGSVRGAVSLSCFFPGCLHGWFSVGKQWVRGGGGGSLSKLCEISNVTFLKQQQPTHKKVYIYIYICVCVCVCVCVYQPLPGYL